METNNAPAAPSTNNTDEENTVNTTATPNTDDATNTAAVTYYDAQGVRLGEVATQTVTVETLAAHAASDSAIAASLLFKALIDTRLFEAVISDNHTWTTTLKRGTCLPDLVGSKTLAGQLAPIIVWYLQNTGDLFDHWTTRDAERQTKPTIGGISAYASGLLSGSSKRKITAADVIQQLVAMITQRLSALEQLPDEPLAIQVRARILEVLRGETLADEERKIYKRALKPRKE
jgi:hypothetical protein